LGTQSDNTTGYIISNNTAIYINKDIITSIYSTDTNLNLSNIYVGGSLYLETDGTGILYANISNICINGSI